MIAQISQSMDTSSVLLQQENILEKALRGTAPPQEATRATTGQNSVNGQGMGDKVAISQEARSLLEEGSDKQASTQKTGVGHFAGIRKEESGEEGADIDPLKQIRKQIEAVKEQLREAQARLAQAQTSASDSVTPDEDPTEAALRATMEALSGSVEAEAIQAEIEILNEQLLMLNNQLQKAMKTGGGAGVTGTAGIGGVANGPSGQGERISVTALTRGSFGAVPVSKAFFISVMDRRVHFVDKIHFFLGTAPKSTSFRSGGSLAVFFLFAEADFLKEGGMHLLNAYCVGINFSSAETLRSRPS